MPPPRRVSPLALVLAASLALSIFIALRLPLLDPDEGRNAEVAREMAVDGDLVIPHLAGMPYLDKPPGFFWAAALSIRALGHTPLAARLPSIIASLLTLWLVGRAAQSAGGTRFAVIAMALLASAPLFAGLSAYVIFDMMLTLCVTVVWLGVAREVEDSGGEVNTRGATNTRVITMRRLAMFAAIAAGILIKGPVMLAWALGGTLGAALMLRSLAPLRWLAWWPGWILAFGIPGAWFAAASARFPEYPHYAFIEESLERLTSNSFHRQQGWWFVPAVLVGGALPWSLVTPWSRSRWREATLGMRSTARVGLGFVLFAAVFFALSHSKLVTYLLPIFPALAWMAATMWNDRRVSHTSGEALILLLLAALIPLGWFAYLTTLPMASRSAEDLWFNRMVYQVTEVLAGLTAIALFGWIRSSRSLVLAATIAWCPALVVAAMPEHAPFGGSAVADTFNMNMSAISGEYLAAAIREHGDRAAIYKGCYSPGTDFMLGRGSRLVSEDGRETTSNYIERYRNLLKSRGLWRALDSLPPDTAAIVVGEPPPPPPMMPIKTHVLPGGKVVYEVPKPTPRTPWPYRGIYSDRRFTAWRFASPGEPIIHR